MDTADQNLFPIELAEHQLAVQVGTYATMYHESDPEVRVLSESRATCASWSTRCCRQQHEHHLHRGAGLGDGGGSPNRKGYDGNPSPRKARRSCRTASSRRARTSSTSSEARRSDSRPRRRWSRHEPVWPQNCRDQFRRPPLAAVLVAADAWKFSSYGRSGQGLHAVRGLDRPQRTERVWVSVADRSAPLGRKRGRTTGWRARGVDINDPAYFVNKNAQPAPRGTCTESRRSSR
jgi:hypothetical protein